MALVVEGEPVGVTPGVARGSTRDHIVGCIAGTSVSESTSSRPGALAAA